MVTDATAEFFAALGSRGREPVLAKSTGTLRFDLTDGTRTTRWLIEIEQGEVGVSRRNAKADCVVRVDRALFDGMVRGEVNGMAAVLRGAVEVDGDPGLLLSFQQLFPGPPRTGS